MSGAGWDWAFVAMAWVLAALAAVLLAWALFWDRARGRKRCPKCWYDMSGGVRDGETGFSCSECGRAVANERSLHKTRRRWRWALIGALLFASTVQVIVNAQGVRDRGLIAAVPLAAIVPLVPTGDLANFMDFRDTRPLGSMAQELQARSAEVTLWHARIVSARVQAAKPEWGPVRAYRYPPPFPPLAIRLSDEEADRLANHAYYVVFGCLGQALRKDEIRLRYTGSTLILSAPASLHDEYELLCGLLVSSNDRVVHLPYSGEMAAVLDIGDMCPPVFGRQIEPVGPSKMESELTPPEGVEFDAFGGPHLWGADASAELVTHLTRSAPRELGSSDMKLQEFPGRLVVWGDEEWVNHVVTTVKRMRQEDPQVP